MNILYYFKEQASAMYQWQRHHIFEDLHHHQCNITIFNPLIYPNTDCANEYLVKLIRTKSFDLFMTPHNETDLYIDSLLAIKQLGIPTLLICFDNLTIPFFYKNICKYFDLVWLTSSETTYLFDRWKATSIFLPYAANPDIYIPDYKTDNTKVLFIGTPYGSRSKMINTLLVNNIPICLHANVGYSQQSLESPSPLALIKSGCNMLKYSIGRKLLFSSALNKLLKRSALEISSTLLEIHPPISLPIMMSTYSKYALALASTANKHSGILRHPVPIVNLRSFEIPAAGGLQFCAYNPEMAGYFEDNHEAVYYHTQEEMIEKARFFLAPEQSALRVKIKQAARQRAKNEHTWFCRFQKAFDNLGLKYE